MDPSAGYKTLPGIGLRQFLMPDRFADDGFLFAFVAYFVAETPVRLQVWRPVGDPSSTDHYQLVCQQRVDVTADQLSQRIVVRITSHTHTHPFNGPFSATTQVSRYQKGKNQSGFY